MTKRVRPRGYLDRLVDTTLHVVLDRLPRLSASRMAAAEPLCGHPCDPLAGARQVAVPLALADQPHAESREAVPCPRDPRIRLDAELDLARGEPLPHLP